MKKKVGYSLLFALGLILFSSDSFACGGPTIQGPSTVALPTVGSNIVEYTIDVSQVPNPGCYTVQWSTFLPIHSVASDGHWIKYLAYNYPGVPTGNVSLNATVYWKQTGCGAVWNTQVISKQVYLYVN